MTKKIYRICLAVLLLAGCTSKKEEKPQEVYSGPLVQEEEMTDEEKELYMIQSCISDYNEDKIAEREEYFQIKIPPFPIGITSLPEISSLSDLQEIKDDSDVTNTAYVGKYDLEEPYQAVFTIFHPKKASFWMNGKIDFCIDPSDVETNNPEFAEYKNALDSLLAQKADVLNWLYGINVELGDEVSPGYYEVLSLGSNHPGSIEDVKALAEQVFTKDFLETNYYPTVFKSFNSVYKMIDDKLCCVLTELYTLPYIEYETEYIIAAEENENAVKLNILSSIEDTVQPKIYELSLIRTANGYRLSDEV